MTVKQHTKTITILFLLLSLFMSSCGYENGKNGTGFEERAATNGIIEIYANGESISVPDDSMAGQIPPQELLKGNPILYNRFRIDGWIFEWIISDYHDDDDFFSEDGVLLIAREDNAEDVQVIHVQGEGVYVRYRELHEELVIEENGDVWVWTENGEEIGRSDQLSQLEIDNLLYNINSEWKITGDRWRTIYNNSR